ncbi:lysophospholipid acyltransferase family protein [Hyalangium versicolor]|uniref:lysophospholipid acyltransferase family protein n=1 Tax=Hyalangium versicolor TaxID=2861190 RepID=UPI001CCC60F2|nr:lysophospholipid acyltransferase family protein [Hyalangium versicolor]
MAFFLLVLASSIATRLTLLVASPWGPQRRIRLGQAILHRFAQIGAWIFGIKLLVRGQLPAPGCLIVANHHSYLDIAALGAATPCLFLAKAEVKRWPLIGPGAAAAGIAFVKRDSARSRKAATEAILERLDLGFSVVNFPTGTTCRSDETLNFRPGLFQSVAGTPIQIVPASLRYEDEHSDWVGDATFVGHLLQLAARPRIRIHLTFSRPVKAAEHDGAHLRQLCEQLVHAPEPAEESPQGGAPASNSHQ